MQRLSLVCNGSTKFYTWEDNNYESFFFVYFHSVVWVNDENMFWPYVNKAVWLTVALGGYFRYEGLLLGQIQYPSCYP